jgi:WhiB family redox-sensing transcriptional regulator
VGLDEDWRTRAACADVDSELFFPIGVTGPAIPQIAAAKAVCAACEVRAACLEFAIVTNQEYGVWGGTSEEERRALRRAWRAEQARQAS